MLYCIRNLLVEHDTGHLLLQMGLNKHWEICAKPVGPQQVLLVSIYSSLYGPALTWGLNATQPRGTIDPLLPGQTHWFSWQCVTNAGSRSFTHCLGICDALPAFIITLMELKQRRECEGCRTKDAEDGRCGSAVFGKNTKEKKLLMRWWLIIDGFFLHFFFLLTSTCHQNVCRVWMPTVVFYKLTWNMTLCFCTTTLWSGFDENLAN